MASLWFLRYVTVAAFITKCYATKCPSSCYCDEGGDYVSCVGDGIWKLPLDIPPTTIRLELRNYLIRDLSAEDMQQLVDLEELKIQQSRIETIDNSTFSRSEKLLRLDLSQNALSSLSSTIFGGLYRLRVLDLSSNYLHGVDEVFIELSNLEQLNLRENQISQLTTRSFVGLQKVQYLNLDANNISTIEVGTFQYLTSLARLIISNNPLTSLSRLDFFGSRLQFIDISRVGLQRVPQSLTKFVRDLRLAKNNLTQISAGDFDSYPHLGLLVLDDNCVSEIENDALGRLEYLMRLWLNGNCLSKVPPNLPPSLLALYMEENRLTELTSYSFKGLVKLEQLFLQRNDIKYLEICAFCDLVSLQSLDLQANQIENLTAGVFANLTNLKTLDLSQNILKLLDSRCFEGLARLNTLQMSRVATEVHLGEALFDPLQNLQNLEVYDSSLLVHGIINSTRLMHGLRNVQELNIMHNKIINLRSDFPSFLPNLKVIKMSGNLWHCDQDIIWLSTWIKQSNLQFSYSYSIRCASPKSLHSKPLMMLTEEDVRLTTEAPVISYSSQLPKTQHSDTLSEGKSLEFVDYHSLILSTAPTFIHKLKQSKVATLSESIQNVLATSRLSETVTSSSISVQPKLMSAFPFRYRIIHDDYPPNSSTFSEIRGIATTTPDASVQSEVPPPFLTELVSGDNTTSFETTTVIASILQNESENLTPSIMGHVTKVNAPKQYEHPLLPQDHQTVTEGTKILQTASAQIRVLSSRLRSWNRVDETTGSSRWDQKTTIIVSTTLAGSCFLIVLGVLTLFTVFRCKHRYQPVKHKHMRRSSSISYYPQNDEVSIVTLTEGTFGLRTNSHHGLGNKLYYIMENGGTTSDPTNEALPDPQLQELLPQTPSESGPVY